ncbi:MAG: hypothetical protein C5B51_20505 [Terriglobia bacterium]|nr:MAG: hypothetical protein C5B51_20505 [Terriglobia bacterium]
MIVASLLFIPALTLILALKLHRNIPWGDEIGLFLVTRLHEGLTLGKLFRFHNEHQIVITKLVIYLDLVLFNGSRLLPLAASFFCGLAVPLIYGWVAWNGGIGLSRNQAMVVTAAAATLYFNGRQFFGLTFPILFVHFSANILILVAFAAVTAFLLPRSNSNVSLTSTRLPIVFVAAYVLASLSSAAGLLIGPTVLAGVGLLFLAAEGEFKRKLTSLATLVGLVTVAITAVYTGAYFMTTDRQGPQALSNVWSMVHFVMLFVGAPFWRDSSWPMEHHANPAGLYLSCLAFWALLVALGITVYRRRRELTAFDCFHVCVIVFVILAACMGAPFRAQLSTVEAINKKYASTELLAWASAASLALRFWPKVLFGAAGNKRRALVLSLMAVVVLLPGDLLEYRMWRNWNQQVEAAVSAFSSDVFSDALFQRFWYDSHQAAAILTDLRRLGKYCFRDTPQVPYPLRDRFQVASVSGALQPLNATVLPETGEPGLDGFLINGHEPATPCGAGFPALLVADPQDRVVGYGSCTEWAAAAHVGNSPPSEFRIFALENGHNAIPVGFVKPPSLVISHTGGKRLPATPDHTDYALEFFNDVKTPLIAPPPHVPATGEISLLGWAVDKAHGRTATGLGVVIEGQEYPAVYGTQRKDVAVYFKQPGFETSGFVFKLPSSKIGTGQHELRLRIHVGSGEEYLETRGYPFFIN